MYSTELTNTLLDIELETLDLEDIAYIVAISPAISKKIGENGITEIFKELYNRGILRSDIILTLHSWALSNLELIKHPNIFIDSAGNYYKNY